MGEPALHRAQAHQGDEPVAQLELPDGRLDRLPGPIQGGLGIGELAGILPPGSGDPGEPLFFEGSAQSLRSVSGIRQDPALESRKQARLDRGEIMPGGRPAIVGEDAPVGSGRERELEAQAFPVGPMPEGGLPPQALALGFEPMPPDRKEGGIDRPDSAQGPLQAREHPLEGRMGVVGEQLEPAVAGDPGEGGGQMLPGVGVERLEMPELGRRIEDQERQDL